MLSIYTEPKQFNFRAILAELIQERVIVRIIDSDLRHRSPALIAGMAADATWPPPPRIRGAGRRRAAGR
jgi:hypothetical protein